LQSSSEKPNDSIGQNNWIGFPNLRKCSVMEEGPLAVKERRGPMSMDNDTRLMMMRLRENNTPAQPVRRTRIRRKNLHRAAGLAAFALTLFTRAA
jgi:hypothetical protein